MKKKSSLQSVVIVSKLCWQVDKLTDRLHLVKSMSHFLYLLIAEFFLRYIVIALCDETVTFISEQAQKQLLQVKLKAGVHLHV